MKTITKRSIKVFIAIVIICFLVMPLLKFALSLCITSFVTASTLFLLPLWIKSNELNVLKKILMVTFAGIIFIGVTYFNEGIGTVLLTYMVILCIVVVISILVNIIAKRKGKKTN